MKYGWARWGDVNAFFGLMLDNLTVMIMLVALITSTTPSPEHYTREFVLTQMIPGTAFGVLLGDLVYTWMAFRLARRTGRTDVTAMPLGLDTPSLFAVGPLVLLPALKIGMENSGNHEQAMVFGWHVAALVLVLTGIFKTLLAPLGGVIRSWVPRAGLLGSLAAIALVLIAFVPLWMHIAVVPLVGMLSLTVILVALVAHRALPFKIPGALGAVLIGVIVFWLGDYFGKQFGIPLVPPAPVHEPNPWRAPMLFPAFAAEFSWWESVFVHALGYLPVMLPFALATIVGGIDCTESAVAAGDEYDTRTVLLAEGIASLAAGLCGGVIQTTPYIGQPAYKAMGGRAAYTLATALFVGIAGISGWFHILFNWLPEAAMFPILVFVGLEITAQSFKATPVRHYPALALAVLPALAYLVSIAQQGDPKTPGDQALLCLANGFIVTSMLWAAALAAILDGRLKRAAAYFFTAGVCSLFGIIHSPLRQAVIALPQHVYEQMTEHIPKSIVKWEEKVPFLCQSPYHWAAAYALAAITLCALAAWRTQPDAASHQE